jgi:polysaccharide export outer membrane protein
VKRWKRQGWGRYLYFLGRRLVLAGMLSAVQAPAGLWLVPQTSAQSLHSSHPQPHSQPYLQSQPPNYQQAYLVGVGDRLQVDFFNVPEYSGEYTVQLDGTLALPVAGAVVVQNLTLDQAAELIETRYRDILRRPIVDVSLVEARPITIALAGEINRPGSYTLSFAGGDQVPNLTEALQLAGGVTQAADVRQIQVQRQQRYGSARVITVNLWDLVQVGDLSQDILLRDGDRIIVPTAIDLDGTEALQLANTTFSANRSTPLAVAVVGEVNRPGPHTLNPDAAGGDDVAIPTVTRAIQTAGGITQAADVRNIHIRRRVAGGGEQVIAVDFWQLLQEGDLSQDLPLQPGDTIVVPTATVLSPAEITELADASFSPESITVNVVGEVARPGSVQLPPNAPLSQAILQAGGFNNRANRRDVELIRLNPDGTITRQELSVDFAQRLDSENNPALRPNDTVIVGESGLAQLSDALRTVLLPVTGVVGLFRLLGL